MSFIRVGVRLEQFLGTFSVLFSVFASFIERLAVEQIMVKLISEQEKSQRSWELMRVAVIPEGR